MTDFEDIPDFGENAYYSDEENCSHGEDLDPVDEWNREFEEEGIA